jgi:hypothetical protein
MLDDYMGDCTEIKAKVKQTVEMSTKYDRVIEDWSVKLESFADKPESEFKPRIDLSRLNSSILKRTREVNQVLQHLIPDNFGYTVDSRDMGASNSD